MEYEQEFAHSFMNRTLAIIQGYEGALDATLLINCLLGLLVVPKEALLSKIPTTSFENLAEWGISPNSIRSFGKCEYGHEHPPNLQQLVRRMRNAVAHFNIVPVHEGSKVIGFSFKDRSGFHAVVTLSEIRELAIKLAVYLEQNA